MMQECNAHGASASNSATYGAYKNTKYMIQECQAYGAIKSVIYILKYQIGGVIKSAIYIIQ